MTNEQILNKRWQDIDKYLLIYLKQYKKVNRETRDKIQEVFDGLNIEYKDINKPIPKAKKNRLNKYINELKKRGLLTEYFGYKARLALSKKNITYAEWLEIMLLGAYVEEYDELLEYNNTLFYNVCENSYNQGLEEIENEEDRNKMFSLPIFYAILNIPILTMNAEQYIKIAELSNAQDLLKKTLVNLQSQKELNVDDDFYKDVFQKQNNKMLCINDGKLSGELAHIVENLSSSAYLQAGIENDVKQCRFVAEMDNKTTKMCDTLNNQIFNLKGMNVYQRYSEIDRRIVNYHTMGLVRGENLPPINNHFHWCRSTITYQI